MTDAERLTADRRRIGQIGAAFGMFEDPEGTASDEGWAKYAEKVVTEALLASDDNAWRRADPWDS